MNTSGTGGDASLTNSCRDATVGLECRRRSDGERQNRQPDADRRVDGRRQLVVHDPGGEGTIELNWATNALTGAVSLNTSGTGGDASLTNSCRDATGGSNVGGDLTVSDSTGGLTQTGGIDGRRQLVVHGSGDGGGDQAEHGDNPLTGAVALNTAGSDAQPDQQPAGTQLAPRMSAAI